MDKQFDTEDIFIQELTEYILENITETLNGDTIGKQFCISRMQLHRKIKASTDYSTSEFIKMIRLEQALKLLKERKFNISEISYKIGFSSPNHFSRVFKEKFGKSPSDL